MIYVNIMKIKNHTRMSVDRWAIILFLPIPPCLPYPTSPPSIPHPTSLPPPSLTLTVSGIQTSLPPQYPSSRYPSPPLYVTHLSLTPTFPYPLHPSPSITQYIPLLCIQPLPTSPPYPNFPPFHPTSLSDTSSLIYVILPLLCIFKFQFRRIAVTDLQQCGAPEHHFPK